MKCRRIQDMMGAYLYGDLSPSEMRDVRLHTQECSACREDLESRGAVVASLDGTAPVLSDEERQSIAWTVRGAVRHVELARHRRGFRWAPAFAVGIMLAAGLAVGALLSLNTAKPPPGVQAAKPGKQEPATATVKITEDRTATARTDEQPESTVTAREDGTGERVNRRRRPDAIDRVAGMVRRGAQFGSISRNSKGGDSHDKAATQDEPVEVEPDTQTAEPRGQGEKLPRPTDLNDAQTSTPDQKNTSE